MTKTILITGSTDGIGLEAAKILASHGHKILLHGRNPDKLETVKEAHTELSTCDGYIADLSDLNAVRNMAADISTSHDHLDVLINNAGVFHTPNFRTSSGQDIRFVVNTIAPYVLTQKLLPLMDRSGRILNLSSAAQATVEEDAIMGRTELAPGSAYAQSKLAITMWSRHLAKELESGPVVIAINPASFLGTKMVKEGYGMEGKDIGIGADILVRASLDPEFRDRSGQYFDNDSGQFAPPHRDALDDVKVQAVMNWIEALI